MTDALVAELERLAALMESEADNIVPENLSMTAAARSLPAEKVATYSYYKGRSDAFTQAATVAKEILR